MEILSFFVLAAGLSADSFAVSICCGISQDINKKQTIQLAIFLALFQGLFPIIGYYLGSYIHEYIETIDHWVAFSILGYLGSKMIWDGISSKEHSSNTPFKELSPQRMMTLAFATSIDALIIGFSYAMATKTNIVVGGFIIFLVTFLFSVAGVRIGKSSKNNLFKNPEIIGGFILIAIGIKILVEHLST